MAGTEIKIFQSLEEIPRDEWRGIEVADFPFARWEFLSALEKGGCLGDRTGWAPLYLTVWEGGSLRAALVSYLKSNSYGEYIFDFQWAQAYQMRKVPYYPKLTSAIPFTPATGPKLLGDSSRFQALLVAVRELAVSLNASSVHHLFVPSSQIDVYRRVGLEVRHSYQYHWKNGRHRGTTADGGPKVIGETNQESANETGLKYDTFEDFLGDLRGKRRREILRERSQAQSSALRIRRITGDELTVDHARIMHRFYQDTVFKMGGFDYLTLGFFVQAFETMKDQILFVLAENSEGRPVAGALNYFGPSTLFGRHWGCLEDYKSLHFELCYYQGIEFTISRGLSLFEAGAQGEHKFQRGFMPSLTYSAHEIFEESLREPIARFMDMEKLQIRRMFEEYEKSTPFSRES